MLQDLLTRDFWQPKIFLVVAACLLLLAWLLFFLVTPPFRTPDEGAHYAYVQSLASGRYPALPKGDSLRYSDIGHELMKAYSFNEIEFPQERIFNAIPPPIDESRSDYADASLQASHPPAYYFVASLFYRAARTLGLSALAIYYATKAGSLFFYLIFVAVFWVFSRTILARREADYLTLAVALQPTLLMVSTSVNPEIGAISLFTLALAVMMTSLKKGSTGMTFGLLMGALSALAVLAKFTNVILVPVAILGLALSLNCGWGRRLRLLATYLFTTSLALTPWFLFNYLQNQSFMPHNAESFGDRTGITINKSVMFFMTVADIKQSLFDLAGNFGWEDTPIFLELRFIYIFIFLFFLGAGIWFFFRQEKTRSRYRPVGFISSLSLIFLVLFMIAYSIYLKPYWLAGLRPRYWLVGLLPAAILFYSGLKQFLRIKKPETLARNLFFFSLLFLLVSILYALVPRFYV